MSSHSEQHTKKRKTGADANANDVSLNIGIGDDLVQELKDMKSVMNQLLEHGLLQTANMARMENKIDQMEEILNYLKEKNSHLEKSLQQARNFMKTANVSSIQRENEFRGSLENRQNYHEALLRNQKWTYSAPIHDEEQSYAANEFLEQIETNTCDIMYGLDNADIVIDAEVSHEASLLPHWEEFANALKQNQFALKCLPEEKESVFQLLNMELPDTVIDLLSDALQSTHFKEFFLKNNNFGHNGIDFALQYAQKNPILKGFFLLQNPNSMKDVRRLCDIVREHPSIKNLGLHACKGATVDGFQMLRSVMTAGEKKLKVVSLSDNDISTGGSAFVSDFLARNPILQRLYLCDNNLHDDDFILIAGALKHNTTLETLTLQGNPVSRTGWAALRKAEFDDTSLNSASDSNHMCTIDYPSEDELRELGDDLLDVSEMNGDPDCEDLYDVREVRQKKIYSVLSSRNGKCSNVQHFDEIPIELLPRILDSIQQYSKYHLKELGQGVHDVKSLSIVFEVMRRWDECFSVYESLGIGSRCTHAIEMSNLTTGVCDE